MKLLKSAILIFILLLAVQVEGWCATKYLRSVGGNFSDNVTWSTTSNGSADTTAPTSSDDVVCDPNSGSAVLTVNVDSNCKTLNQTGFIGTLAGSGNIFAYGSITFDPNQTITHTGRLIFQGIATLTTNGKTLTCADVSPNNNLTLGDNLTINGLIQMGNGIFNTNNKNINCTLFKSSSSFAKTFNLGSSTITCTSLDLTGTNQTFNYNTSSIVVNQAATGTMSFSHGSCQFYNLTLNGFNDKVSQKLFAGDLTVNNNLSLQGNSIINRLYVKSDTTGTKRTLTAKTVDLDNVDFQDITFAGDAVWSGVSVGDCGGNSGTITYTTPVTRYWVGNAGSWSNIAKWSASSGGAGNETVPLCHDTVIFDPNSITSGSQTITCDMPRIGKDVSFTGVANTPALSFSQDSYIFGSLTFASGMTLANTGKKLYFESRNNCNFTSGEITNPLVINFNNYGATLTLQDNLTISASNIYLLSGNLNDNGKTITFTSSGSNVGQLNFESSLSRNLTASGNWTWAGNIYNNFLYTNILTGLSITATNSTFSLASTDANLKYFRGGNFTWGNLKFTGTSGAMVIASSNTFNTLESDTTAGANTISLTASSIQSLTKLFANTAPTKKLTLQSTTTTPAVLTSSRDQFIRYTDPNYITFQGTGNWYFDATTGTQANCTGLITTRNFSTFNTARNTFNPNIKLGGNTTSKY